MSCFATMALAENNLVTRKRRFAVVCARHFDVFVIGSTLSTYDEKTKTLEYHREAYRDVCDAEETLRQAKDKYEWQLRMNR